jgi:hypothetical protein
MAVSQGTQISDRLCPWAVHSTDRIQTETVPARCLTRGGSALALMSVSRADRRLSAENSFIRNPSAPTASTVCGPTRAAMGVTVKEEIPICHILTVAAACFEREPRTRTERGLRAAAKEEAKKLAEGRDCGQAGKCQSSGVGSL